MSDNMDVKHDDSEDIENSVDESADDMFDFEEDVKDIANDSVSHDIPQYGSTGWNDYVMTFFEPGELYDGNPNCAALRRVCELLLGDIISSGPSQVFPATDGNGPGRATVVFEVVFDWNNEGQLRTFREVADCWHGNADDLFCAYPVAMASTRAEGRALRKALKVKCLASEELTRNKDVASVVRQSIKVEGPTNGEISPTDKISDAQIRFIDQKCKQLDIGVMKYIAMGKVKYSDITEITKDTASKMLKVLNLYQTGENVIPDEIKGYSKNWR